jgi:hypothetical protein
MTNGMKLLGVGVFSFLVVIVGSVALADESHQTAQPVVVESVVEQPPRIVDQYEAYALVAEELDKFLAEQARIEAEKAKKQRAAEAAARQSVAPNYDPGDGSRWDQLAICESGGNWAYPPVAGGFSGGIMFHIGTWRSNGGLEFAPDAYLATREQQIIVAERVLAASGWRAWPGCSRKFGWL